MTASPPGLTAAWFVDGRAGDRRRENVLRLPRPGSGGALKRPRSEPDSRPDMSPANGGLLMAEVTIEATPNGPYLVAGPIELRDTDGKTLPTKGKVWLCRCGASTKKPLCDGTHSSRPQHPRPRAGRAVALRSPSAAAGAGSRAAGRRRTPPPTARGCPRTGARPASRCRGAARPRSWRRPRTTSSAAAVSGWGSLHDLFKTAR